MTHLSHHNLCVCVCVGGLRTNLRRQWRHGRQHGDCGGSTLSGRVVRNSNTKGVRLHLSRTSAQSSRVSQNRRACDSSNVAPHRRQKAGAQCRVSRNMLGDQDTFFEPIWFEFLIKQTLQARFPSSASGERVASG